MRELNNILILNVNNILGKQPVMGCFLFTFKKGMALGKLEADFDPFRDAFRDYEMFGNGELDHVLDGGLETQTNANGDRGVRSFTSSFPPTTKLFVSAPDDLAKALNVEDQLRVGRLRLPTQSGYDENCG